MPPERRIRALTMVAGVALLTLGACRARPSGQADPGAPDASVSLPAASEIPAAPHDERIVVQAVRGLVRVRGRDGVARTLAASDVLALDDTVFTARNGSATLGIGAASVVVQPRSRLAVLEAARDVGRVLLSAGRMSAALPEGGPTRLRVTVPRSDAAATTTGGRISALTDGHGLLSVAAEQGRATLVSAGHEVVVGSGQQAEAHAGEAPSAPHPIPPTLFLKIEPPAVRAQRESQLALSGETLPGALVASGSRRVAADAKGRFTILVPLKEGRNLLVVEAEDAAGRNAVRQAGAVTLRRHAPSVAHRVRW